MATRPLTISTTTMPQSRTNAFETQVRKLYAKGMTVEYLAGMLKIPEEEIRLICGLVEEVVPVPGAIPVVRPVINIQLPGEAPQPDIDVTGMTKEEIARFGIKMLMLVAANPKAHASARVAAAVILMDEGKGRREVQMMSEQITSAAKLNEAIITLRNSRKNPYAHLDKPKEEINITNTQ